jgi:hypothetical protein
MRRALFLFIGGLLVACSLLTSFEGIEPRASGDDGAAPDGDAGAPPPEGCPKTRWPEPPASDDQGRDLAEIVAAVEMLRVLDPVVEGKLQGFDLDGLCTCPDRPACVGARPDEPCDPADSGGIDNVADSLFREFADAGAALEDDGLPAGLEAGQFGVVFRISGYNGGANDRDVKVTVANAVDVNPGTDAGARFDGTDVWVLDRDSFVDDRFPLFIATTAYVRDGVLVASLPNLVLRSRIPNGPDTWSLVQVELRHAWVVARLARRGDGFALVDGQIAGRSPAAALLAQVMRAGACKDSPVYRVVRPLICDARDLPLAPANDGRDAPCEAVSTALGFRAGPALVAPESATRVDDLPCVIEDDECR